MTTVVRPQKRWPMLRLIAIGALAGASGFGFGWLFAGQIPAEALASLGWSDFLALIIALLMLISGGLVLTGARNNRSLAAMLKSDDPASGREVADMRMHGLVVMGSGLILAAPSLAVMAGNPAPNGTFFALMAAFAIHSIINFTVWRRGDEMVREIVSRTSAVCFWGAQGALFVWAAADRLGLAPAISPWDALAVLMAFYLTTSMIISVRRGLS